jgi:hypothetical protein
MTESSRCSRGRLESLCTLEEPFERQTPRREISAPCPPDDASSISICWTLVPAGGGGACDSLVPPLRALLPRRGGAAGRGWASRSTTSRSTGGSNASRRCSPTRPGSPRHTVGDRWFVDETYVKVRSQWRYVYRAVDQFGQVVGVYVPSGAMARRRAGSSNGRWPPRRSRRLRSSRTRPRCTRACCRSAVAFAELANAI